MVCLLVSKQTVPFGVFCQNIKTYIVVLLFTCEEYYYTIKYRCKLLIFTNCFNKKIETICVNLKTISFCLLISLLYIYP